jgi:hypothetical protein
MESGSTIYTAKYHNERLRRSQSGVFLVLRSLLLLADRTRQQIGAEALS